MTKSKSSKPESAKIASEDGMVSKLDHQGFLIVGIGASAGGIQALKEFFKNVPADSGMAYVVILHLSPDHDSRLAEVLQNVAQIPVTQVKKKVKVEPDHVYVVPPNKHLGLSDGHINVEQNVSIEERRAPVDIFFRALAESHRARAIAVVLSGTGANGSMGIKRIKERGGVAFVQNPREAEFSEMPRNSIATDLIDQVLNVAEIPAKIIAYKNNLGAVAILDYPESRPENDQAALREIFAVLRVCTGHDFTNYKHPTVLRRIERRINVHELQNLADYAVYLRDNIDEAIALLKDLLISVTNFFRDKEAFEFLERDVVPRILQNKSLQDTIRIWVAGCATGEEAYSLAILFVEQTENARATAPAIQIFATDIDEDAIANSREGFYTLNDAADVSPERLRRFFIKDGDGFRIRRELREMVLFANHNLLKDAPFSHLDLVTCRNLLIYFNGTAQERAMETFHFALNPGAFLFLGTSESIDGAGDLYAPVSKEHHIYQSRQAAAKIAYPVPDVPAAIHYFEPKTLPPSITGGTTQEQENRLLERISFGDLHQQLLEQYAAPSIVVNENYDIVHLSDRAGRFLQIAGGEPSKNLLYLIRPELRLELRTALYQAVQSGANVEASNVRLEINGQAETVNLQIRPVLRAEDTARGFILVLFEPSKNEDDEDATVKRVIQSDEPLARRLEQELERTKTQLRTTVGQYEVQTEELRASNEELQAMNEELRSTAEELETSREELQSVNEELMTVNDELKNSIEELSVSNDNFQNLLNSTDIGTIFLDHALRIKMFTPPAREVFNLIDADINRPLADITTKLVFADLHTDVERVLETLQTIEREFETAKGKWYLLRVFPYRTAEDRISGVVVTFIDITNRIETEHALQNLMQAREQQRRIFNTTLSTINDFAYIFDKDGRFLYSNDPLLKLLGITAEEIVGKNFFDLNYPEDLAARLQSQIQHVFETKETVRDETPFTSSAGTSGYYEYIFNPVFASDGSVESVVGSTRDITTLKQSEINFAFLAEISQDLVHLTTDDEIMKNVGAKIGAFFNISLCAFTDVNEASGEATITHSWRCPGVQSLIGTYRIDEFLTSEFQRLSRAGEVFVVNDTVKDSRVDWKKYHALGVGAFVSFPIVRDGKWLFHLVMFDSEAHGWRTDEIELMREITARIWTSIERRRAEDALRESEERFRAMFEQANIGIVQTTMDGQLLAPNPGFCKIIGYAEEEARRLFLREITHPDDYEREMELTRQLIAGEIPGYSIEKRFIHKDKSFIWGEMTATLMRHPDGKPSFVLAVVEDTSERKRAEAAARESDERMRLLVESATDYAIFTVTSDNLVDSWNTGAEKLFGYSEQEIIGKSNSLLFTPEDRKQGVPEQEIKTAAKTGRAGDERWHIRNDNSRFYASGVMMPLKQGEGFVKIARDMTDKIKTEATEHEKEMLQRMVVAQEDERKRIARDLHDELGQQLTALRLKLETTRKECETHEIRARIDEIQLMVKHIDADLDFLAWELRPAALDDLGLVAALSNYVNEWSKHAGVTAEFHSTGLKRKRFASEIETNLYRIAQETLNNVHKHAGAKRVDVMIENRQGSIILIIEDDGKGFNPKSKMNRSKGLGLMGIQERATLVGGNVEIESAPKQGTTIYVRVPSSLTKER